MRIVCISDTHTCNEEIVVPDGDILVHAGDSLTNGTIQEFEAFIGWFTSLPHLHKFLIAGNHDWVFQLFPDKATGMIPPSIVYLQDSSVELMGMKVYGSPWQPRFYDWAFNLNRGPEMAEKWAMIPEDTEILITHGPPQGILDEVETEFGGSHEGCEELRQRVEHLAKYGKLKLHIFGHIHSGHGVHEEFGVKFVNASICDEEYKPSQRPIVIDL